MSNFQSSSVSARERLRAESVRLGSDTNFDMACFTACFGLRAFICSSVFGGRALCSDSFADSALDILSDPCHEGVD